MMTSTTVTIYVRFRST